MKQSLSMSPLLKEEPVKAAQSYQPCQEYQKKETVELLNQKFIAENYLQNQEHNKYQSPWKFRLFHKKVQLQVV